MCHLMPQRLVCCPTSNMKLTRRQFLRRGVHSCTALAVGLPVYARLEAAWCRVRRTTVTVPKLPAEFKARTIALLTDIHHGPYVSLDYVRRVVRMTNQLNPYAICLCGVGDLWEDKQDLQAALGDAGDDDAALLLSHNPDYVEHIKDGRVGLVLSGHTHGGQVVVPFYGAPVVPSAYGRKYAQGLVRTDVTQVFVSRGIGNIAPPIRFNCRPEIALLTLA